MSVRALIGLGGNLGDVRATMAAATAAIDALHGLAVVARSRFYRTPPWGNPNQPDFINAAIAVDSELAPIDLLDALMAIEAAFGRLRDGERWGPRRLDLDLLAYGDQAIHSERLTVPHPRIPQRAFVLLPLADVAPDARLPGQGRVMDLLAAVDATGCSVLP